MWQTEIETFKLVDNLSWPGGENLKVFLSYGID